MLPDEDGGSGCVLCLLLEVEQVSCSGNVRGSVVTAVMVVMLRLRSCSSLSLGPGGRSNARRPRVIGSTPASTPGQPISIVSLPSLHRTTVAESDGDRPCHISVSSSRILRRLRFHLASELSVSCHQQQEYQKTIIPLGLSSCSLPYAA
jgi:hypothetical protein